MKLPNGENAIIPEGKLRDYLLNEEHTRGKDKAIVFRRALGITTENIEALDSIVLQCAVDGESVFVRRDDYGSHYRVELEVQGLKKEEILRTLWIIRRGETAPRLVSAYIR